MMTHGWKMATIMANPGRSGGRGGKTTRSLTNDNNNYNEIMKTSIPFQIATILSEHDVKGVPAGLRFAVVEKYHRQWDKAQARGNWIVSDMVTGVVFQIDPRLAIDVNDLHIPLQGTRCPTDSLTGFDLADAWIDRQYRDAMAVAKKVRGVAPGALFSVGVADGVAHYVVVHVKKTTCEIAWRGFAPDRYHGDVFGMGGTFRIKDVAKFIQDDDLFGEESSIPFSWDDVEKANGMAIITKAFEERRSAAA